MCRNATGALRQLFAGSVHHKPSVALLAVTAAISMPASAFQFETGSDIQVRWDNTFKYSNAWRVGNRIGKLVADPTLDDGDRNFNRGLISNRLDLLSELDVAYKGTGFRVSGAAWYDDVYNRANDNDSPYTANSVSVKYNEFTHKTRELHGRNAEFLDAFAYSDFKLGKEMWGVARLGQHALLYGESMFFGNNSIAAGQQPIDGIRALSVPNSQFKELGLPVNQASAQLQLTPSLSMGAYYQFAWERTRIPAAGSYFSPADLLDGGGERIVVAAVPGVGPVRSFYRAKDIEARDSGQGGCRSGTIPRRWGPTSVSMPSVTTTRISRCRYARAPESVQMHRPTKSANTCWFSRKTSRPMASAPTVVSAMPTSALRRPFVTMRRWSAEP